MTTTTPDILALQQRIADLEAETQRLREDRRIIYGCFREQLYMYDLQVGYEDLDLVDRTMHLSGHDLGRALDDELRLVYSSSHYQTMDY